MSNTAEISLSIVCKYLCHVGYVTSEYESYSDAYARIQKENPELFPVPSEYQSMIEAMREVVERA
jgi:hypothetical protein